jgi:hypothetical protein
MDTGSSLRRHRHSFSINFGFLEVGENESVSTAIFKDGGLKWMMIILRRFCVGDLMFRWIWSILIAMEFLDIRL